MGSKKKIGVRIDEDLWERFVNHVDDTHGRTHGVVGSELERAILNYIEGDDTDALRRIEDDVSSINASVADLVRRIDRMEQQAEGVEADGGGGAVSRRSHTHTDGPHTSTVEDDTDNEGDDEKPHPKAPKSAKVEWYANQTVPELPIAAPAKAFRAWVDEAWSFGERAGDDILRRVFDRYHAKAVKRDPDDAWEVVIAATRDKRETKIDQYGAEDGVVYVMEYESGTHVEGADVFDHLLK